LPDKYRGVQMLGKPAGRPEEAVYADFGPQGSKADCKVVSKKLRKSLGAQYFHFTRIDRGGGAYLSPGDVQTQKPLIGADHAVAELDRSICWQLQAVWLAALLRLRAQDEQQDEIEVRMHGNTYHFSTFSPGPGYRSGSTWSPEPGTKMADWCESRTFERESSRDRSQTAPRSCWNASSTKNRSRGWEPRQSLDVAVVRD